MKIVTIIPFTKGPMKENLTYFTAKAITVGSLVEATLRNKKLLGLVVSSEDVSVAKGELKGLDFNLKKIVDVKEHSIFRKEYFGAIEKTNKYFVGRINDGFTTLIPALLKEEHDKIAHWVGKNTTENNSPKNIRTEKLLFQANFEDRISYYKTLIRTSFAEKKSIFVVLPSESEVKEFEGLIGKGIEQFTFAFSSKTIKKKTLEQIEKMVKTEHAVLIIGTSPYLALPRQDINTIILEHESSSAYKMPFSPSYDLRVFVEIFASLINAKLLLCDTLLRFETFARKELDDLAEVSPLSFRINQDIEIEIIPRVTERLKREFSIFTEENIASMKKVLAKNENVFIFSLRKGLATMTICRDCNDIVVCNKCSAPLVLYLSRDGKKRMLVCNRCGGEKDPDTKCGTCGSWNLFPLGIGSDGVFEEIKKNFPKTKIFKLDKEEVSTAKGAESVVEEFEKSSGAILVGTQMALFYMKEKVSYSIVASFDSLYSMPNFKIGEKTLELLFSIIEKTKKKILVITKNTEDGALLALKNENLLSFVRSELEDRHTLGYPPYKRFIKISHLGDKQQMSDAKALLTKLFEEYEINIFSGFVGKRKDKYATNALIRLPNKDWSLPELQTGGVINDRLFTLLLSLWPNFTVSIDPENLL